MLKRDAKRDIGGELLRSVREMKAGKRGKVHSPVAQARYKVGLSQSQFAELLGVSVRTLQDWELSQCFDFLWPCWITNLNVS